MYLIFLKGKQTCIKKLLKSKFKISKSFIYHFNNNTLLARELF